MVERRARRACRRRPRARRRRPRRRRAPTRRPGSGPAARASRNSRLDRLQLLLPWRVELLLERAGRLDLRRPLVGRGLADLLRRRVLARAQRRRPPGTSARRVSSTREHLVDQAGAHALALDAAPVLRLVAQPLEVDHASPARGSARAAASTHDGRVLPRAPVRPAAFDAGFDRTADRIASRGTSPRPASPTRLRSASATSSSAM